jgi:hypothetical protein
MSCLLAPLSVIAGLAPCSLSPDLPQGKHVPYRDSHFATGNKCRGTKCTNLSLKQRAYSPFVLDGVLATPRQVACNFSPLVADPAMRPGQRVLFLPTPWVLAQFRPQVILSGERMFIRCVCVCACACVLNLCLVCACGDSVGIKRAN